MTQRPTAAPSAGPLLSICIPTFNRQAQLKVCLESIFQELNSVNKKLIEIVISDNVSSDGTERFCRDLMNDYGFLFYFRNDENIECGNFVQVVERAHGTYCWLLGDDDAVLPGTLERVLETLASGHDIYLGPRIACDDNLKPMGLQKWHFGTPEAEWDLSSTPELIRYFNQCSAMGGIFSFISSQVFRKAAWDSVPLPDGPWTGTNYCHVYRLLAFAGTSLRLKLLDFPLVLGRILGVDGALPNFWQLTLDIEFMLPLAKALGYRRNGAVWDAFFGVIRRNHCGDHYPRMIRLRAPDDATWGAFLPKLVQIGYAIPYLEALDRAYHFGPLSTALPLSEAVDPAVGYALEHMAFLLSGVRALAVVSLGPASGTQAALDLVRALKGRLPDTRVLFVGTPGQDAARSLLGEGDRYLELRPDALEGDPALQKAVAQAGRDMEVGIAVNAVNPRTRPSDIACALLPAFARLGPPGADPRVDPLYTAVLPAGALGTTPAEAGRALGLALGLTLELPSIPAAVK